MAQREGVDPAILRAVVARDLTAMPYEVALAARFAEASLRHAPEADDLREEVVRQFGKRGLISLAFALVAGAHLSDAEICAGLRPSVHAVTIGGATAAGAAPIDQSAHERFRRATTNASEISRPIGAR